MLNFLLWLLTVIASCISGSVPPPPTAPPACELELSLDRMDSDADFGRGAAHLVARATNVSGQELTFSFTRPCPDGPARFTGWDDYDFYGTCTDGVCDPLAPVETLTLAPGEEVVLSTLFNDQPGVDFDGNACNPPVPGGVEHLVSFELIDLVGAVACGPEPVTILAPH